MKKFLLASAAVAALTAGIAQADNSFTGWNFGAQGGLAINKFETKSTTTNFKAKKNQTGSTFGIFTGYGSQFENNFYLGGELEANLFTGTATKTITPVTIKTKVKNDIGANLRAGYVFNNNVLGYVLAGVNSTDVENEIRIPGAKTKKSKRLNGYKFGAGTEVKWDEAYFARLQYDFKTTKHKEIIKGNKTELDQHNVRFGLGMII